MLWRVDVRCSLLMIRVLYILHTLNRAGVEKLVYDLICANDNVIEAGVVCLDSEGELADDLKKKGIRVYFTDRKSGIDLRQVFSLSKIIKEFKPDIIHAHQYTPVFYSLLGKMLCGDVKLIFTEHGRCFPDNVSRKRRLFNRLLFGKISAITAVCEFTKRALVENEGIESDRIEIIYNGVKSDLAADPIDKESIGVCDDCPVAVHLGNFRPVKNQEFALRGLKLLLERGKRVCFVFIGDGDTLRRCVALSEELGVGDYVRFLGRRNDVFSILPLADFMINTSISEAFSVALLEGMSVGLPVVATDVGGNREIVLHNRTGLLVGVDADDEFADAVEYLLCDSDARERLGKAGRERVISEFSFERMNRSYLSLYKRVAGI